MAFGPGAGRTELFFLLVLDILFQTFDLQFDLTGTHSIGRVR